MFGLLPNAVSHNSTLSQTQRRSLLSCPLHGCPKHPDTTHLKTETCATCVNEEKIKRNVEQKNREISMDCVGDLERVKKEAAKKAAAAKKENI